MEIYLENIGKVKTANISIRGITVIAGENDTGKSTVSKGLFSMFHGFYHLKEKIHRDKKENLANLLSRTFITKDNHSDSVETSRSNNEARKKYFGQIANTLLEKFSATVTSDYQSLSSEFKKFFQENFEGLFSDETIDELFPKFLDLLNIQNTEIGKSILSRTLNVEFYNQVNSLYTKDTGKIKLTIKQKTNSVVVKSNKVTQLDENIPIETDVIYFDNPLLLNQVQTMFLSKENFHFADHQEWLLWNLQNNLRYPYLDKMVEQNSDSFVTEEILIEKRLQKIYEKLNIICGGTVISKKNVLGEWTYKQEDDREIFLKNLSTGLKTFVILKFLLQKGALSFGSTLILDEPEIHVHPKWQLVLAELIVLLNKEFQVHILLNTHSPYFLRAIEVYSQKHGISDKCDYYLSELNSDGAEIRSCIHKENKLNYDYEQKQFKQKSISN